MARVVAGDEAAFASLVHRHLDAIHAYAFRLGSPAHNCEDIAQETFLRVWRKASTYKPGDVRFTTWLYRIAHNLCVDAHRKTGPQQALQDNTAVSESADHNTPELVADQTELQKRLANALTELPDNQRTALVLCHLHGQSNSDAAAILGVGVRAVESLLARARRTLKTKLRRVAPAAQDSAADNNIACNSQHNTGAGT